MSNQVPKSKEQYSSHIPALKTLIACGWEFLSTEAYLAQRGNTRNSLGITAKEFVNAKKSSPTLRLRDLKLLTGKRRVKVDP